MIVNNKAGSSGSRLVIRARKLPPGKAEGGGANSAAYSAVAVAVIGDSSGIVAEQEGLAPGGLAERGAYRRWPGRTGPPAGAGRGYSSCSPSPPAPPPFRPRSGAPSP